MMRVLERKALVTGAGQGIGEAIALGLAAEGADVAVVDINAESASRTAAEIRRLGRQSIAEHVDLAHAGAIPAMVEHAVSEFGRLDILVNCAGIVQTKPFLEITESDWDRIVDINQKAFFFCMQAAARQMVKQAEACQIVPRREGETADPISCGKIVSISSVSGRRGRALQAPYAATKAAIISLTQSAALDFAPHQINVNAVAPSIVLTPMWDKIAEDRGRLSGAGKAASVESFIERIPLNRAGTGPDIAGAVTFLCSADADYITGQCLNVDGGFEMD